MNNPKDFRKKDDGVVVNTNTRDYIRARNRKKMFGKNGKVQNMFMEFDSVKDTIDQFDDKLKEMSSNIQDEVSGIKQMLIEVVRSQERLAKIQEKNENQKYETESVMPKNDVEENKDGSNNS
jgi:septation ring formation regulator EzrA